MFGSRWYSLVAALCVTACASAPAHQSVNQSVATGDRASSDRDWAALAIERLPGLVPCTPPNVAEPVLCGTVDVPEDRSREDGRLLTLDIIVVPAQRVDPPEDPVFVFEGGPGGAVTRRAASMVYAGPVRARDIVLVDQRGTAGSHRISCDLGGGSPRLGALDEMFPAEAVRRCAETLSALASLGHYGTADFVDDVEQVREQLGYGPINIRGGSYGTRAMMTFAQRYPSSTRSLFGIGVVSPSRSNLAERGIWAERVLSALSDLCAQDAACGQVVPDFVSSVSRLLETLEAGPRTVTAPDPNAPETTLTLDVTRPWLVEKLRLLLYFTFTSRALPWAVERAVLDDWTPLTQLAVVVQRMFQSSLAYGVLLTVQCGEGMNFDLEAARARGADTLFGNHRLDQQVQGCANWPHERRPPLGVAVPRVLETPALFLSGALDPVTPPAYADDAAAYFPNQHHVVLAEGHHGPFDLEDAWVCVHELWADFLDRGAVEGLDVACAATLHRPPFIVDASGFAQYLVDELAPMGG